MKTMVEISSTQNAIIASEYAMKNWSSAAIKVDAAKATHVTPCAGHWIASRKIHASPRMGRNTTAM